MIYIYINGRDGVAPAVFLASCWAFLASCWYKLLAAATSAKLPAGQEEKGITVNHFTKSLCSIRRINSQSSWLCDHQKWSVEVDVSKLSAHVCICRNMAQTHRFMRTKRSCNSLVASWNCVLVCSFSSQKFLPFHILGSASPHRSEKASPCNKPFCLGINLVSTVKVDRVGPPFAFFHKACCRFSRETAGFWAKIQISVAKSWWSWSKRCRASAMCPFPSLHWVGRDIVILIYWADMGWPRWAEGHESLVTKTA